jgi:hypothetical protein
MKFILIALALSLILSSAFAECSHELQVKGSQLSAVEGSFYVEGGEGRYK